jgi:hypothetical protein
MRIETAEDFERARERLRRRDSESLVAFLMSLALDSGPVGEQVRTFIVGDDVGETVESLRRGENNWDVDCAYQRATGVMAEAAKHLLPKA